MTIEFSSQKEIVDRMRVDVVSKLPESDPTIEGNLLDVIITTLANAVVANQDDLKLLIRQSFPQQANENSLDFHGELYGVARNPATTSEGVTVFNGDVGTIIAEGTKFSNSLGEIYTALEDTTLGILNLNILDLTSSGGFAKATFASEHGLASNISVNISGANQLEYNGAFIINVISELEIEYPIEGSPVSPATGILILDTNIARVLMRSDNKNAQTNASSGAQITSTTAIVGLESPGFVDFRELSGGADLETKSSYAQRIIDKRSTADALFSEEVIVNQVKTVPGVTRVFVLSLTPDVGQVTVYFLRDNDENIIPSPQEVDDVKEVLLEIKPVTTADEDVIVLAPTPIVTDFVFTEVNPDSSELRQELTNNLTAFFIEEVDFEETVLQANYESVIYTTIDPKTGQTVKSFTLSSPIGDIVVGQGEIGALGFVSFAI